MSAKPAAAAAVPAATEAPKKKGKGMLILIAATVLVLAGGGGGAWFFMNKKAQDTEQDEASTTKAVAAPTYMAMENMVVNLADPGGERFAQIGITLDVDSEATAARIKSIMPTIRSRVLMLASQRTSDELLKRDGKEKLADDVVAEVSRALGYEVDEPKATKAKAEADDEAEPPKKRKKKPAATPVHGVLFSAFIIQ